MRTYKVRIALYDNQGFEKKHYVDECTEAETPLKALQKYLICGEYPMKVKSVFVKNKDEYHGINGNVSYDVCPADW